MVSLFNNAQELKCQVKKPTFYFVKAPFSRHIQHFSSQLHKGNNNLSIDVYYLAFSFVYEQNTTKNRFLNSKKTRGIGLFSVYATPTECLCYAKLTKLKKTGVDNNPALFTSCKMLSLGIVQITLTLLLLNRIFAQ